MFEAYDYLLEKGGNQETGDFVRNSRNRKKDKQKADRTSDTSYLMTMLEVIKGVATLFLWT